MNDTSIAIVGCGNIGRRHAEEAVKNGKIVAVCDTDADKANAFAQQYHCRAFYDINELLSTPETLQLVSICTPNGLHAPQSITALEHGTHVLCEKPMAISTHDAAAMIRASKANDRRLFIVKQNRYNPPVAFIKNLIDDGALGNILGFQVNGFWNRPAAYYKDWRGTRALDGGTLFTQFSHFIDLILWLFGDITPVSFTQANSAHPGIEFEDSGIVNFRLPSGAVGCFSYTVNTWQKNMEGSITVFGEKGTVKIGGQYLNELEYFNVKDHQKPDLPIGNGANQYGNYQGSMSNHDKIYQNVIKALHDANHPFLEGEEAIATVALIEKIYSLSNPYR